MDVKQRPGRRRNQERPSETTEKPRAKRRLNDGSDSNIVSRNPNNTNYHTRAARKGAPNLLQQAPNNPVRKRPRRDSSPSSPPPPTSSSLASSHQPTSLARKSRKLNNENPPISGIRRAERPMASVSALTTTKQPVKSRDSPDPLDTISGSDRSSSARTRAANANPVASYASSTTNAASTRRSGRRRDQSQPVVLEDEAATVESGSVPDDPKDPAGKEPRGRPATAQTAQDEQASGKRSLRSHGPGTKSQLAMYFANYEQMISLEPVKHDSIVPETVVTFVDDQTESPFALSASSSSPPRTRTQFRQEEDSSPFGNPLQNLHACEIIELPDPGDVDHDPLDDDVYFKAHRRHERQERQLRNIEKERAQHEKIQLDRLLDELQGHDWLRTMGITGITETEKKLYEPKRDLLIREVSALLEKFNRWKEEEKRRKTQRSQTLRPSSQSAVVKSREPADLDGAEDEAPTASTCDTQSLGESSESNDVDALAARQLLQEARSVSAPRQILPSGAEDTPPTADVRPFTSFYAKKHIRDAAVAGHRRGRHRTAFGQPIPDVEEREFELPPDILTPVALSAMNRKRRRLKRESRR
ncbi:hypothetical protein VTN31DRAFT_2775 [Thermomyces dupontii]|uniref:uncharacterized protein n=1 Tax=Talaromyces thermophilus TaxID=28565 RepID=UPI003743CDC4